MTSYQKLILSYAQVLQLYSCSGPLIFKSLEAKRLLYSEDPDKIEKYRFWGEVTDIFVGNSQKVLFDVFRGEEMSARKDPDKINEIIYLKQKKHTNATLWYTMVPDITQYVYYILKSKLNFTKMHKNLQLIENASERMLRKNELNPSLFATKCALYPYMKGYKVNVEKTKYFKFIPLLMWSLENLFYYGRYSPECDQFLQTVVIHILRLHKQYADEMLVLMHREDELYTASQVFGQEVQFNPKNTLKENAEYCDFSMQLQTSINMKEYTKLNYPAVRSMKKSNLLFSIYRIEKLIDLYGVTGYFHTINEPDLERALNSVNHHTYVFSDDNIKATLINRIYRLATSPSFYDEEEFNRIYNEVMTSLENLIHINILSAADALEVKKEVERPVKMRRETIARCTHI